MSRPPRVYAWRAKAWQVPSGGSCGRSTAGAEPVQQRLARALALPAVPVVPGWVTSIEGLRTSVGGPLSGNARAPTSAPLLVMKESAGKSCIAGACSGSLRGGSGGLAVHRDRSRSLWPAGSYRDSGLVALRSSEGWPRGRLPLAGAVGWAVVPPALAAHSSDGGAADRSLSTERLPRSGIRGC